MGLSELMREVDGSPEDLRVRGRLAEWFAKNGDPDRAEFVRLQIEAMRFGLRTPDEIAARAAALLKKHEGRWRTVTCTECGGKRKSASGGTCLTCDGAGDVGGLVILTILKSGVDASWTLPVEWRGGTPHAITCRLWEAFCADGSLTRWAFRLGSHHRTVREFRLVDRGPADYDGLWWLRAGDRDDCDADACRVPRALLETVKAVGDHTLARHAKSDATRVTSLGFCDAPTAKAALATAAGATVRAAVAAAAKRP